MIDLPARRPEKKESPFRKFKHPLKRKFLRAFAQIGMVGRAAEAAGIHRDYHYEVVRRGIEGFDHPIIYEGKITGSYKAYSDNLAMFFLEGLRPFTNQGRHQG